MRSSARLCRKAKPYRDVCVEASVYLRSLATTISFEEEQRDKNGKVTRQVTQKKHLPDDIEAAKFWVSNGQGDLWRLKSETIVANYSRIEIKSLTDEQLEQLISRLQDDL